MREKKVYVNGQPLEEPYTHFLQPVTAASEFHEMTSFDVRERYGPVTVPPNQYFVMGDNRDNSQDSRYWGFLPRDYIKGKALVIYWSYEAGREDYQEGRRYPEGARLGVRAFFHAHALGPDAPPDQIAEMLKLLMKLAVAALIANAVWRVGTAVSPYYRFTDAVTQTAQFGTEKSRTDLPQRRRAGLAVPRAARGKRIHRPAHDERNHTLIDGGTPSRSI